MWNVFIFNIFIILDGLDYIISRIQPQYDTLQMDLNVDGAQVFSSSIQCMWPILGRIIGIPTSTFIIGLYYGTKKPQCPAQFLNFTISEIDTLTTDGYKYLSHSYDFKLSKVLCDTPARSFVKGSKSCTGYFGCDKCSVEGEYLGRVVFLGHGALRTDDSFRSRENPEHHIRESPFELINIDMIKAFPLDYMHLVCEGVVRKCLMNLCSAKIPYKCSTNGFNAITNILTNCNVVCDFSRKPRTLKHLGLWKATELRIFILYVVPLLTYCTEIHKDLVSTLTTLHLLVFLSCHPEMHTLIIDIDNLAKLFIQQCKVIWGSQFIVYNVHSLTHLSQDLSEHGVLDNFSCFWAENFIRFVKTKARGSRFILEQVIKRVTERDVCLGHLQIHSTDVILSRPTGDFVDGHESFAKIEIAHRSIILKTSPPDNIVYINNNLVCSLRAIYKSDVTTMLCGYKYRIIGNVYENPFPSSKFSIFHVDGPNNDCITFPIDDIFCKGLLMQHENISIIVPILHTIKHN